MNEIIEKALDIIKSQKNAYIGSVDESGFPNIKAMQVRGVNGINTIYFSTEASTMRVQQYKNNPQACVYFSNNGKYKGVMLVGTMEVTTDKATREMVWREGDDFYYPKGIDDSSFNVLKFTILSGRVYDELKSLNFIVE
ncbi:MAG: pyridoxamine 5'-phosphate oxidase family protein [Tannerella sp.]|jgi:general stress protein 26|nr:pyridoxamine 5'-phosphate oxidase family protein [Tannerella sp.]